MLLASVTLSTLAAYAQNWNTGFRLGVRYDNIDYYYDNDARAYGEIGLFVKRKVYKRFSLDIGVSYFHLRNSGNLEFSRLPNGQIPSGRYNAYQNIFYSNIGVTYTIIQKQRITTYVSAGFVNRHAFLKTNYEDKSHIQYGWLFDDKSFNQTIANTVYIGAGSNYELNRNLFLNLNARVETLGQNITGQDAAMFWGPLLIPSIQFGIGYKF